MGDRSGTIVLVLVLVLVFAVPAVITVFKGKYGLVLLGLLFHPCWWFGAIRLAKPDSFWAGYFYDLRKLQRAQARYAPRQPAPSPPA
ncbi:hypothetical protein ACIOD2_04410 [Amycolatopsis sp. NPDC088138]|uniref:hypothetical protein n=1 Tax=Amycolatopsis sp. NPDC088138 TaxID=3363938 RepID=UPI003814558D